MSIGGQSGSPWHDHVLKPRSANDGKEEQQTAALAGFRSSQEVALLKREF